ncbi:fructose-bisphosphate aldolase 1 [Stemphylium lycopersici]|nr:fructose-bisphosphate aldolase 1 [Stemphylium lycopersici]
MELLNAFVPPTIDFYRQRIEQDSPTRERVGASGAADILTAAAMGRAKASANAIYGSVSSADLVTTIKGALAHNDEAARVMLNEADVKFVSGHEEGDASRVKQLGTFKAEIRLPGAEEPLLHKLFKHAQSEGYAIPAINVTSSSTVVASLEAARDSKSPIILQLSNGGAAYFAGKGVANSNQEASIAGSIAAAHYIRSIAPSYGIPMIEMEIGITGGEEDGVSNEDVDNNLLYTQPEDIYDIYKELSAVSPLFSIAAGFGNVHGVYKPGNVKLRPELLQKHQQYVKEKTGSKDDKPVFLVFHGGSGSGVKDFQDAISYGVVKVNLDTDMQWAYLSGIRDYVQSKSGYLQTQVGNPEGEDKPNKKYYDPRVWVREGEKTMSSRITVALKDFFTVGKA